MRLCRIVPNDDKPPVELQVDMLQDDQNWKILDLLPE